MVLPDNDMELQKDKEAKKRLVLDSIAKHCIRSSIPVMQEFERELASAAASEGGTASASASVSAAATDDAFGIRIISGGFTNYSYKIWLKRDPSKAVFAKITFPYALWNTDRTKHYDLERTVNEFELMVTFGRIAPGCAAKPFLCLDVTNDTKLLVTEWVTADEQWGNQMIDGSVDVRIGPKFATALAMLHSLRDFDPDFNSAAARSECCKGSFSMLSECFDDLLTNPGAFPRSCELANDIGRATFSRILEVSLRNYLESRECLVHSDSHAFNVLVEPKPDESQNSSFGPNGTMILCDFEMALVGPQGKDVGMFLAFPTACALAHAMNGHPDATQNMLDTIDLVWTTYAGELRANGRNDEFIRRVFHNAQGWAGWFILLAHMFFPHHNNLMPIDSDEERDLHRDSMGVIGFSLFRTFLEDPTEMMADNDDDDQECHMAFLQMIQTEIRRAEMMARLRRVPAKPRRASQLRASGRRESDAVLYASMVEALAIGSFDLGDVDDDDDDRDKSDEDKPETIVVPP